MTTIQDILTVDLNEDIKHVIDLEDQSENEIQSEIESYIVTDGLGNHFSNFINQYTSNIKETGVWLSGFFGSGKSYFGKMLGHLIKNQMINGTSARDRFMPRINGVVNQSLIENDIRKLDSINSRVIFLDIAKQNTDNGLAFTLFSNFLKTLGFREDLYGYMEFELFVDGKYDFLNEKSKELFGKEWNEIKKSNREVAKAMRRIYLAMDYDEVEYDDTKNVYSEAIKTFSSSKLKTELVKYLEKTDNETLVFIFDETSEALSQNKFDLIDLEGISESLSSIGNKVWTIAIAQEKLDAVINNAKLKRSQLNKVTDRFKTKIHLDSTDVDIIIKSRLLQKKEDAYPNILAYYSKHEGMITDATNLKSSFPTKTETAESFATYYPFHKYQFDLLQKFLFSSKTLVANQVAARGMIITTFDILRKKLRTRKLYEFTTAHDLCSEAQTAPPVELMNKYNNANLIIKNNDLDLNGENLLKTIHFINESVFISPTLENITKAYITEIDTYYKFKPSLEKALTFLVEGKILLLSNNNYKITSNEESKLLGEMKDFDVELFIKKRELVGYLKKLKPLRDVSVINEDAVAYNFNILTDLDDEIMGAGKKNLRLTVYSLFNITENRLDFIESLKMDTQYTKNLITLIPDNSRFDEIDKLMEEVKRYSYMQEKYGNDEDQNKRQIIREFSTIKDEKEKDLITLIEEAYVNGSVIYLFNENLLDKEHFKSTLNDVQKKLIRNIYTKRLKHQLSEAIAPKIVYEGSGDKLHKYFSGDEFKFFDTKGNFVGDHLKVVEETKTKVNARFIDGRSLEDELSIAPWGYSYGTISTTLAVLFRAGRLVVKINDTDYFSYRDKPVHDIFVSSTKFKTARFKSITKTLTATQKDELVQLLLDLDFAKHTGNKINWETSDFELADSITQLADHFLSSLKTLKDTQADFSTIFRNVYKQKDVLRNYASKTTEANYISNTEAFLENKDTYINAINTIVKAEKFIKRNLDKIKAFDRFVKSVNTELDKAGIHNQLVVDKTIEFNEAMEEDVVERFTDIQNAAQAIKDAYYLLMDKNAATMSKQHSDLSTKIINARADLASNYPAELNKINADNLDTLSKYCNKRTINKVNLKYAIECQDSKFSLSDILNYIALLPAKETELQMIIGNFVKTAPLPPDPGKPKQPKKIQFTVPKKVMKASEYRRLLSTQIQAMAGMDNNDEIELNITTNDQ